MKAREPRRTVLVRARMRTGSRWTDVTIHNISSRGMMVETEHPPDPGTYIEIRRGAEVVIGRVVWRITRNFGILAQDRIDIDAIIRDPGPEGMQRTAARGGPTRGSPALARRRTTLADMAYRADRSRYVSSFLQYALLVAAGLAAAGFAAGEVYNLLTRPMTATVTHLQQD